MEILDETEDLMFNCIMALPIAEQRGIRSSSAIINSIDEESEQEIKDAIWESIKNSISYNAILNRLNVHLNNIIETPVVSEEEEEEEEEE
jgi:hypothetical protein